MRNNLLIIPLLLCLCRADAQTGFSKTILYPEALGCNIAAVTIDQDTIVCYGTLYGAEELRWGVYLAKFDTLGNLLQLNTDFDSVLQQTVNPSSQILKTSDGGYIGIGSQGVGVNSAVYKFAHDGTLEWKHFYREDNMQVILANSVAELQDGYLIFGRYAVNYDGNTFVLKVSKNGELMWFGKEVSIPGVDDTTLGRYISIDNNLVLGGNTQKYNSSLLDPGFWSKVRLVEVDSVGKVQWEWYSENLDKESFAIGLAADADQNIVYCTTRYFKNVLNGYNCKWMLRKVNRQSGSTIWKKEVPSVDFPVSSSGPYHMKASPDGKGVHIVGAAQEWYSGTEIVNLLLHYDWDGNLLWQRYDTVYVDTSLWINENVLYNLDYLSSGSIIAVGKVESGTPYSHAKGWLIKWDANGCFEPGDCATVNSSEAPPDTNRGWPQWEVYPNPAGDHIWLYPPEGMTCREAALQIVNASGRTVRVIPLDTTQKSGYRIPLNDLENGLYFYQVVSEGLVKAAGRLVVFR